MSAGISFTDGVGAATLVNVATGTVASRFVNWTPRTEPVGDSAVAMGTGATMLFSYRTDYLVDFDLPHIGNVAVTGVAPVDLATRLIAWLLAGGTCSVATGDLASNVYATCGLAPKSKPSLKMSNKHPIEYTLSLSLINLAGSPGPFLCRY